MNKYIKGNIGIVKKDLLDYVTIEFDRTMSTFLIKAKLGGLLSDTVVIGRYKKIYEVENEISRIYMELENNKKRGSIWGYVRNKLGVKKNGSIHIFKL